MRPEISPKLLKNIYPLNKLNDEQINGLRQDMRVFPLRARRALFGVGDSPDEYFYVLEGSVQLINDKETEFSDVSPVGGGESIPLPYMTPSMHRAVALDDATVLGVKRDSLDAAVRELANQYAPVYRRPSREAGRTTAAPSLSSSMQFDTETVDTAEPSAQPGLETRYPVGGWRHTMLTTSGFSRVPLQNMDQAFSMMQPMSLRAGDILIEQDEPPDDFYVMASGHCQVLFKARGQNKLLPVNQYGPGGTIGEDALISGLPRNASVRMTEDSVVMRLEGDAFRLLIKPHLARPLSVEEASLMSQHGAQWIDVRMPRELDQKRIRDGLTIPHPIIRARLFNADPSIPYIVVCATLRDAPVIAFNLCKNGLDAYFLKGGIDAVPEKLLSHS